MRIFRPAGSSLERRRETCTSIYTDFPLIEGQAVELTLVMPSEITLAENMPVRGRGKVTRIAQMNGASKTGVAVHLEGYEYLPVTTPVTEVSSRAGRPIPMIRTNQKRSALSAHTFTFRPIAI